MFLLIQKNIKFTKKLKKKTIFRRKKSVKSTYNFCAAQINKFSVSLITQNVWKFLQKFNCSAYLAHYEKLGYIKKKIRHFLYF